MEHSPNQWRKLIYAEVMRRNLAIGFKQTHTGAICINAMRIYTDEINFVIYFIYSIVKLQQEKTLKN